MNSFVIMANDFPHAVMEEGTTFEEAQKVADHLSENDPANSQRFAGSFIRRVYYRAHTVQVLGKLK